MEQPPDYAAIRKAWAWLRDSSTTYQAILEEGRAAAREEARAVGFREGWAIGFGEGQMIGARRIMLDLGTEKFGPPDSATVTALDRLTNLDTLRHLLRSILRASSWHELLATNTGR